MAVTGLFTPADQPEPRWRIWKEHADGTRDLVAVACDEHTAAAWEAAGCDVTEIVPQWPWEEEQT